MSEESPAEPIPARRRRRCPNCAKPMVMRYRPFCSPRCRDLDLGRWLNGAYAVPAVEIDDDEAMDQPPEPEVER